MTRFLIALALVLALSACVGEEISLEEAVQNACAEDGDYDINGVRTTKEGDLFFESGKLVVKARISGSDIHSFTSYYDPSGETLTKKRESILIGGVNYQRDTIPDSPNVWDEWGIDGSTYHVIFPGLCYEADGLKRVGTRHYIVNYDDGEGEYEMWIDLKGRPSRILGESDDAQAELTFSDFGQTNSITAPMVD